MKGDVTNERGRKRQQLVKIFHILQMRRPMFEYNTFISLFNLLKVPMLLRKRWLEDLVSWTFPDFMYKEMLNKAK
jgi:hypothetical protein